MALEDYFEGLGTPKKSSALKKNTPTVPKKSSSLDDYFASPVSERATVEAETKRVSEAFKGQEISTYVPGKNRIPFKEKLKTFADNIFHRNESQTAKTMRLQQSAFDDLVDKPSIDDKDGVSPFSSVQKTREIKRSNIPTAKGIVKGLTDVSKSDLPYAGAAIDTVEITKILNSANKIKNGEEIDPEDYLKLKQFLETQDENSKRMEADAGYRVGSGLRQSLTFMLELLGAAAIAPTSGGTSVATLVSEKGAYMAAKEIALKMSTDAALKAILQKELKTYGVQLAKRGAVVLGTQEATHITNDAFERMIGTPTFTNNMGQVDVTIANDGQSVPEAFTNAFTGILVETGSEFTGGLFHVLPKATRDALIKSGILKEMIDKNKDIPASALIKITEKLGWHGVFEEMGEEQVGNIAYGVLHDMGLSDVDFTPPTMKGLAEQLLTFSLMGTAMTGVQNGYQKVVAKKLDEEMPSGINNITKPLDEYMNEAIVSLPASEIVTDLKGVGIDAQTASDLVSTYRRKQNKADIGAADAMTPEDIQATIAETLGAITEQDTKELDVNQEGMSKTKADTRKVNPDTKGLTPEDLQNSIDEIMGGTPETDAKTIEEDAVADDTLAEVADSISQEIEQSIPEEVRAEAEQAWEEEALPALEEQITEIKKAPKLTALAEEASTLEAKKKTKEITPEESTRLSEVKKEAKKEKAKVAKKVSEAGVKAEEEFVKKYQKKGKEKKAAKEAEKKDIPIGTEAVSTEELDAFIAKGEKKTEAKTPKSKETPDEKRRRLEKERVTKGVAELTKSDKARVSTLYDRFKRMFEIYNEARDKDSNINVAEGYEIALEGLIAEGVQLSEYDKRFLLNKIQYMSDGRTADIDTFTEYAVSADLLSNQGKDDPNYPMVEPAEFNEEGVTFVNEGDYIVDGEGYIEIVTSGNMKYKGSTKSLDENEKYYLRSRNLRGTQDSMQYANQIRLATPEEIAIAKDYENGIDNQQAGGTIKSNGKGRKNAIPDTSDLPAGDDRGSDFETTSEAPGYDEAAVLAESGNGLEREGATGKRKVGKKGRQLINEQVEELLEAREYSSNPEDYSQEDRTLMAAYTGAGGKESVGAEGAGLLNEYYTPKALIEKVWGIAERLSPTAETAFEPSAGIGRFITESPKGIRVDGAEISKVSGTIARVLNPDSNITIGDFQELFFDKKTNKQKDVAQYDLVVGNPPFGDRAGFLKGKGEEKDIGREEEYFIKRGIDMLKPGGHLVYIVNSSFLKSGTSKGKERIADVGHLIEAYRLPEGIFEDTSIGTDIVVFKKYEKEDPLHALNIQSLRDDMFFRGVSNSSKVLGETKVRKNRFGQTETYVEGDLESALKEINVDKKIVEPPVEKEVTEAPKPIEGKAKKARVQKPPTRSQTIAPREVSPDAIIPRQSVSNKSKYSKEEVTILSRIDRDESIPSPSASEMPYLNYQGGKYYHDGNYFAGEIYQKLDQLKNDKQIIVDILGEDQYNKQKTGLEAVIPKVIPIKDISFDPIDRHIAEIKTTTAENNYETTVLGAFTSFLRRNSVALSPRVTKYDVMRYVQGERASQDTKPIMGSIKADAKRLFNQFIKNDLKPETQAEIEAKYNKEKNGYVRPDYSQIPTEVENMAKQFRGQDFSLSQTQKEGVGFLVNKGSGMIAYGVGVGKTHTLAIATVANMQKGWTKRPLFVVPKATITKTWLGTLQEMFPTLTINNLEGLQADVVSRLKREKGEVKNWLKDGELNVISHEGILRLGFNEEELREAAGDLNDALWKEEKTKRGEAKDAAKMDEILGQAQKYVTDIMISDLGIDHLSVDEVHNFRKVFQGAKAEKEGTGGRKRFGNVIGGTPSKRAQQLFLMSQYVQKRNGNRNVFLASATPFENHATEVYNILSFVARDRMKSMGILNINDFFATFANFEIELDRKLDGTWIDREKMKSFANLPTLQGLLREFIDYQEDETLVRPERRVLTPHLQMSAEQTANLAKIQNLLMGKKEETMIDESDGAEMFSTDEGGKAEDGAFLKASSYSIANSVSPYFIKEYTKKAPTAEQLVENSPKIKYAVEVLKTVKDNPKTRDYGTFIYFGKMGVEYHPMIKEYLVEKLGYKSEQVAVLSGNVTDEEKEDIKEKFNNGVVKVLLGGDQTKEGIDLQQNGFITLNLALGWNPTQIAQVEGRVWRQGNKRSIAPLIYPLVENSGDAMIYSKFEEKGGRINDLFSYKGKMFDVGEIDPAEKKLALLTDPKDKANMQIEIDKATLYNERVMLDNDIKELEKIRADKNQTEEDITYYAGILETGERYGRSITKTEVTEYKKELKAAKDRSERIAKKLETKNITDIAASIGVLEGQMLDIDNKIKAVQETYEVKLKHFTELYKEEIKNRKSYADHMKEISAIVGELKERTPEEIAGIRAIKIASLENKRRMATPEFSRIADVEFAEKLSLKTLDRLGNRETVSKQFISDLTNMGDIKQVERDVIRDALEGEGNTVDVDAFRKKVNDQLLPLTTNGDIASGEVLQRYEYVVLPDELRGNVSDYTERVYESPVATSAGDIHFGSSPMGDEGGIQNYFGHTRIEDMADYETRRVIEVQSDLYQKGRLERESMAGEFIQRRIQQLEDEGMYPNQARNQVDAEIQQGFLKNRETEIKKLKQYNDPTAHFRMVREEVRLAALDDKTKLQFPTGETAMKIEGLGTADTWVTTVQTKIGDSTYPEDLFLGRETQPKVGMEIQRTIGGDTYTRADSNESWIITDVLEEGKFKAVPKDQMLESDTALTVREHIKETFDISGKVDQNNPIYKFYEKELGRYLKNRYNATRVTDAQGVEWYEVSVKPEAAKAPVEAFLKNTATKERMIKFDEAKARLEAYKTRLGLDFDVDFADVIFTGEVQGAGFQRVRGQAYGVTYNNKITLIDNITETTADHELVHQVVNNIDKIKVFDGITRDQLYKAANGGKAYSQDQITELDEVLAIGFQEKLKGESQSNVPDILRRFYERLQIAFTKLFQALGGHVDVIQDFYRRLASANASETVKMKSNPALDRGIRFEANGRSVMDFSMSDRVTELVDTTKAGFLKVAELGEQPDFSVNLRRRDMNELDNLLAQARDLYLKDPVEFKEADSFMKIGDERRMKKSILDNRFSEMLKPYFDMKTAERAGVDKVLMQGDMDAKEYNETELAAMGLSKAQIEAYKTVRKGFNTAHQLLIEEMYKSGVKEEEIEQFEKERVGYMPHKWKYRFAIKTQTLKEGNDPREDSSWRTFTMDVYRTAREADKAFQKLRNENKDPNKRFVSDTLDSLDVDFFTEQRFSFENMKSIISKAKTSTDVKTELLSGLRNMIKEKGFGRHFIKRTGIQGYETKEIPNVIANYFSGLNGFVTKMDAGKKYYGVLENIDARRQKKFYAWVRDSIAYDMGNSKEWDGLKQVAFIYHLANDISFLLTNATQNFTIGVGEISKLAKGVNKLYTGETAILKATVDWAFKRLSPDEKAAITGLLKVGRLGGEMTAELMGFKNNPLYRTVSKTFNKALYHTTSFVEQNVNRVPAFLAARRVLIAQGLSNKEANEQALAVSDDINFRYGKQHRPVFMRGKKGVFFIFNHYIRSYLYQLSRDLKKKEYISVSKKMFYTFLLAGTAGLPFAKLIKLIVKEVFGDDDEEVAKELNTWELALQRGLPASFLNIDLSGRVGIDVMAISNILEDPGNVLSYLGAVGNLMFDRLPKGYDLLTQERYNEAIAKLLPDMVGTPFKAYNGVEHGVYTQAGNPLIDENGNDFKYTTYEGFVKATGFTPTREQLAWDEMAKEWDSQDKKAAKSADQRAKIKNAIEAGDYEAAKNLQEQGRLDGYLSEEKDYVRNSIKDETIKDKLEQIAGGNTNQSLASMEREIAKATYGTNYTAQNLSNVSQEFAYRRTFGFDNKLAEEIWTAKSNAAKVELLKQAREEMGLAEFKKFFEKGRKSVRYQSGRSGHVLISDDLRDLYFGKK